MIQTAPFCTNFQANASPIFKSMPAFFSSTLKSSIVENLDGDHKMETWHVKIHNSYNLLNKFAALLPENEKLGS